jgi:hypothetical protein
MTLTDGGRTSESNNRQLANASNAINQHCEADSNLTQRRDLHSLKAESWMALTEAGIVIIERQDKEQKVCDFN